MAPPPDGEYGLASYSWDFDDPDSGNWTTGRQAQDGTFPSRNAASGYVTAHVFELPDGAPPGTFRVELTVTQTTESVTSYFQDITVAGFSGKSFHVSSSSGHDTNSGMEAAPFKTLAKGLSMLGPGRRLLLKRGEQRRTSVIACRRDG